MSLPFLVLFAGLQSGSTPPLTGPYWDARAPQSQSIARFGSAVSNAGDVNGDGFEDVVVGSQGFSNGQPNEGAAFLYLGSPTGLSTIPAWSFESNVASAYLGSTISGAGDVNRDGFDDFIVGAPNHPVNGYVNSGRVFLFLGHAGGPGAAPDWTYSGFGPNAVMGASLSSGDVNGDGYSDVLLSTPNYGTILPDPLGFGRALAFYGGPAGLSATPDWGKGFTANVAFGSAISCAGDVNGDGYDDVAVGAAQFSLQYQYEGAVFLYLGSHSGLQSNSSWTILGGQNSAFLGMALAGAGDTDGDGYDDLLVGVPKWDVTPNDDHGAAHLYRGSPFGPGLTPSWSIFGSTTNDSVGGSVAGVGDTNRDGYADIAVGNPDWNELGTTWLVSSGRVDVFLGGQAGAAIVSSWAATGGGYNVQFGAEISAAGDVNGDGAADLLIGQPMYPPVASGNGAGRALTYWGTSLCAPPVAYCAAGTSTSGCSPILNAQGIPSASASSGFNLVANGLESQKQCLFFYGLSGPRASIWSPGSSSSICAKTPLQRMSAFNTGGTAGACDGFGSVDWLAYLSNHPAALGNPMAPGTVVWSQAWYRDPPAPGGTNLSGGLMFVTCP